MNSGIYDADTGDELEEETSKITSGWIKNESESLSSSLSTVKTIIESSIIAFNQVDEITTLGDECRDNYYFYID